MEAQTRGAQLAGLTADVSISARPFFERYGFTVEEEQHPVKSGVRLVCHTKDQVATVWDHLNVR